MVKISFAPIFFLLSALSSVSLAFPIEPRDVSKFEVCLRRLSDDAVKLASDLTNVDENDLVIGGVDITLAFVQVLIVDADLKECNSDTLKLPVFSEGQTETIVNVVQGIVPYVKKSLTEIVKKQSIFKSYVVSGTITGATLEEVEASVTTLANSVIKLVPAWDTLALRRVESIKKELQVAFEEAINDFN